MQKNYRYITIFPNIFPLEPMNPRILESSVAGLLIVLLFVLYPQKTFAFHAEVSPKKISPGDAFLVKITGTSKEPSGTFAKKKLHFTDYDEGCFVAIGAVDLKTKPGVYTVRLKSGKKRKQVTLRVKKTKFPKLELTLPEDKVFLSPEDLARVQNENEKLLNIFRSFSAMQLQGPFIMPLDNEISGAFGTKRIMNKKRISVHKGIDIRGGEGEGIKASNSGTIVLAEELFFGGNTVIIDHGQGIYTIYMHLSAFKAQSGDTLEKGDIIGLVGSSGRSTGPHLHFGVKILNINVNPVSLIQLEL